MNTTHLQSPNLVRPTRVRYIKLGREQKWEKECVEKGIIRFGFDSASEERFPLCLAGQWGSSAELKDYVGKLSDLGPYDKMFFVYHSGDASTDDERATVIGPDRLAELAIDAGLANWLIRKVS